MINFENLCLFALHMSNNFSIKMKFYLKILKYTHILENIYSSDVESVISTYITHFQDQYQDMETRDDF